MPIPGYPTKDSSKLRLHGVPIDLGRVRCDSYLLDGTTDHITPWKGCYRNTQLLGGSSCTASAAQPWFSRVTMIP